MEFLSTLDILVFRFLNGTLQNPLFDWLMPFLTDLNKHPLALVFVVILWILLLVKGGRAGRIAALLLIPTIAFSDQLNSTFVKHLVDRPRPCHMLAGVHLLVSCGSGWSFPSSHAVNNFAGAVVLATYLPRWSWAFYAFAATIAFSRVYVGVHYPSDVLGGTLLGFACGWLMVFLYRYGEGWWLRIRSGGRE